MSEIDKEGKQDADRNGRSRSRILRAEPSSRRRH